MVRTTTSSIVAITTAITSSRPCPTLTLPAGGVLSIAGEVAITLASAAVYQPSCTASSTISTSTSTSTAAASPVEVGFSDFRDPFYASIFPGCYALAATTVIAYTLVIMLFITPRSFLDGGIPVLGRRGFTNAGSGGVNIGGRPWLQKWAATFVAISLTIATVNTFKAAEDQYAQDISNAVLLQEEVLDGTELKSIRIISEAFLWLAQAQTLTRLFPRQREKIIIKWAAFALIALGVVFDSLNSFYYNTTTATARPRSFTEAIPALSYLFQLSLGVLYAAWVLYYALMKKQYAFYHHKMRNMGLVAMISVVAILVPIVFFILDISKPDFTGWGDYVRWVGGAAASVVVWEWVERIEALEREEKKDGILGREIFDGDDMFEMGTSEFSWPRKRRTRRKDSMGRGDDGDSSMHNIIASPPESHDRSKFGVAMSTLAAKYGKRNKMSQPEIRVPREDGEAQGAASGRSDRATRRTRPPLWPARPPPVLTPVSRTETASADSTVYVVRFDPTSDSSRTNGLTPPLSTTPGIVRTHSRRDSTEVRPGPSPDSTEATTSGAADSAAGVSEHSSQGKSHRWQLNREARQPSVSRKKDQSQSSAGSSSESGRWHVRGRLENFAASKAEQVREKIRPTVDTDNLPLTIVPAPPRRGAALAQLLEEEEDSNNQPCHMAISVPYQPYDEYEGHVPGPNSPPLWRGVSNRHGASSSAGRQTPHSATTTTTTTMTEGDSPSSQEPGPRQPSSAGAGPASSCVQTASTPSPVNATRRPAQS